MATLTCDICGAVFYAGNPADALHDHRLAMHSGRPPTPAAAEARETKATEATSSAHWRSEGKPDPHAGRYDVERARLPGGDLTDDVVANRVAMLMRSDIEFEATLTIAKDRIRWLSRALERALSLPPPEAKEGAAPMTDGELRAPFEASRDGAAPSPETGGPDLVPLDVFNEAERTHMAMVRETAAKAATATGRTATAAEVEQACETYSDLTGTSEYGPMEATLNAVFALSAAPAAPSPDLAAQLPGASSNAATGQAGAVPRSAAGYGKTGSATLPTGASPDLASLIEAVRRAAYADSGNEPSRSVLDRAIDDLYAVLKAQPNAGPSADGGKGGANG